MMCFPKLFWLSLQLQDDTLAAAFDAVGNAPAAGAWTVGRPPDLPRRRTDDTELPLA